MNRINEVETKIDFPSKFHRIIEVKQRDQTHTVQYICSISVSRPNNRTWAALDVGQVLNAHYTQIQSLIKRKTMKNTLYCDGINERLSLLFQGFTEAPPGLFFFV